MQLSKSVCVQIILLPLLPLIFTGTVNTFITFDPVLIDAHFTSSWLIWCRCFSYLSGSSFLFLLNFDLYSIVGCRPLQTLNCLLLEQLLHYVPPKFVLESHKKVISCESSYFDPQQLVLKLLCNPQYHTDLHILGTRKFLYSRFLMSPRYFRNVFYFLWYLRFQWFIFVLSDSLSGK